MTDAHKEYIIARVCSGTIRIKVDERHFIIRKCPREITYEAVEHYQEVFEQASLDGLYSDDELLQFLYEHDFWDDEKEKLLKSLPKEIEQFKVAIFKSTFKSDERKKIRAALKIAKQKYTELHTERHAYDHLSCSGSASNAKLRYLVGRGLHSVDGTPIFPSAESFWAADSSLSDKVLTSMLHSRLDDKDLREVARTEPWLSVWNNRGAESSLFGVSPIDYTEEQRTLTGWSTLYESIIKHPKCPSDEVMADDDMMDGWLIVQRKEREDASNKNDVEDAISNPKIKNSQEVFVIAQTREDAEKVMDMNSPHAKNMLKARFRTIENNGIVKEADMPDSKMAIRQQLSQQFSAKMGAK